MGPSNTAGEAIEKMLQEKKISNKINYDILKTLTAPAISEESTEEAIEERELVIENEDFKEPARPGSSKKAKPNINLSFNRRSKPIMGLPVASDDEDVESKDKISTETGEIIFSSTKNQFY